MSYKALYRKWRPSTFDEVYGQDHITSILKFQVANNRHSHAYLFCGSRGTGKTSCAKILAKALNCLDSVNGEPCGKCEACRAVEEGRAIDIVEMDAASNNGVDNIREIVESVSFLPVSLKYRVYIIDEVHMLSNQAFNALLKTLEEPPEHIVFVLATTEFHKILPTIVSRCQRFDFARIPTELLAERMVEIAKTEGAEITSDGAFLIAKLANGGFRDAISMLEMCISKHQLIDEALVSDTLGICGRDVLYALVCAVNNKNYADIFRILTEVERSSKDIGVFVEDIISWYRNMILVKSVEDCEKYLACTIAELEMIKKTAAMFDFSRLVYHSRVLDDTLAAIKRQAGSKRNLTELALIRMSEPSLSVEYDALLSRICELESKVLNLSVGVPVSSPAVTAPASPFVDDKNVVAPAFGEPALPEQPDFFDSDPKEESSAVDSPMWWEEVVEKISKVNASVGAYLRGTELKIVNNTYNIAVRGRTALIMISREANISLLAKYISAMSGSTVTPDMIKLSVESAKKTSDPSDELFR